MRRALGGSGLEVCAIGVGTNRWGGRGVDDAQVASTFAASLEAGLDFFDTAEVYNRGRSERLLGETTGNHERRVVVATKFAPLPTRLTKGQCLKALEASRRRLGVETVDLYYLHFPFSLVGVGTWMEAMAEAVAQNHVRAVGISNCNVRQMHRAADVLARHDIALAANQVHYSLLHRRPESNGVLDACREMNVALVAYRPLEGGRLGRDGDGRAGSDGGLAQTITRVAAAHGATPSQVGLSWLLARDPHVVVIPGASKARHATENAGALRFTLTDEEFEELSGASDGTRP